MAIPKVALGSAQWGLQYGIAGHPKASKNEISKILALAALNNIKVIDTAHQYGNALDILGSLSHIIKKNKFKIVLKIPKIPENVNLWKIQDVKAQIFADFARLKTDYVDTLMVHDASVFLEPGADIIYDMIVNMKYLGFCRQVGVSVYDPNELKIILSRYGLDVVSFPANIMDQRFQNKSVEYMSALRIEMHARSLFLQGLLLMPHNQAMDKLTWEFQRVFKRIYAKFRGDMLKACLSYLRQQYPINYGVIGVHSVEQLSEIIQTYNGINSWYNFDSFEINDLRVIDPRKW